MQETDSLIFYIFIIFAGSAVLATLALYARQALLVAYIVLGIVLGPAGLAVVSNTQLVTSIADIGIIFLLFLLGLNLQPQDLLRMLRKSTLVTVISSIAFGIFGFGVGHVFGFTVSENLLIGASVMFSSTIIALKLLPTTVLHHKHAGEMIVSILLLQDLVAIVVLLMLEGFSKQGGSSWVDAFVLAFNLPLLIGFAITFQRYVLSKLIRRFDKIQEYIFLMAIGWCLSMAELAGVLGLSHEIGAFVAGIVLASGIIARFIAESLKPLRDFFLVIFFFSLGAKLNLLVLYSILIPAFILAAVMLWVKPYVFKGILVRLGEEDALSFEMGCRLGQISEFSLLIAVVALESKVISDSASYLIQTATILTFIASSYFIVQNYPTPIAVSDRLRRD